MAQEFIDETLASSFLAKKSENYQKCFRAFSPWLYYTYKGYPTRCYQLIEDDETTVLFYNAVVMHGSNNLQHVRILMPCVDLEIFPKWSDEHLKIISSCDTAIAQIFTIKLGYLAIDDNEIGLFSD